LFDEGERAGAREGLGPGSRPDHRHRVAALARRALGRTRGLGSHGYPLQGPSRSQAHPAPRNLRGPPAAEGLPAHRPRRADGLSQVRALMTDEARRPVMSIEEEFEGDLGTKRMLVNFGPQHPATHGTLRNIIELDGERVVRLEP